MFFLSICLLPGLAYFDSDGFDSLKADGVGVQLNGKNTDGEPPQSGEHSRVARADDAPTRARTRDRVDDLNPVEMFIVPLKGTCHRRHQLGLILVTLSSLSSVTV